MKRRLGVLTLGLAVALSIALPAGAITDGYPDDEGEYPTVGQFFIYVPDAIDSRFGPEDPGAWYSCTGTLLSSTVVITAGHCTFGVGMNGDATNTADFPVVDGNLWGVGDFEGNGSGGNDIWINFELEPDWDSIPPSTDYYNEDDCPVWDDDPICETDNEGRYNARVDYLDGTEGTKWIRGTASPHPYYNDAAFLLFDLGVVELGLLEGESTPGGPYADLVGVGGMNKYERNGKNTAKDRFTAVGYGLREIVPRFEYGDVRYIADGLKIIDATGVLGINERTGWPDTALLFSNNPGKAHRGGTCFGDSGGPIFNGDGMIAAITSFGLNQNCKGTGGGYRIDKALDQGWLGTFLDS